MQRSIAIAQQSANPQGILGRIIAIILMSNKVIFLLKGRLTILVIMVQFYRVKLKCQVKFSTI